ncbi:DUF5995 family protein [Gilvibacter sediminis]|uniref:DUF5995 family protein n=1 Tax=Gilvibacter sediminis TaxID=379071 RepID=UPI002350C7DA|nr:DUF5995 family protein [Gilvibacter sediminis]MDC7997715.1 DUF5995 family protein [Gilvibacter sediminis]
MGATTIDAVIDDLQNIVDTAIAQEDALGYFAALYLKVTQRVKEKIDAGFFDDNPRMERLDVVFANRYIDAYQQYKSGEKPTKSWQVAFDATVDNKIIVLQHLLAGMNAHINLDLGIAAAQITDPASIASLENDFNKINEVLGELLTEVQDSLARIWPTLLWILRKTKNVDDFLVNFSMSIAREGAWKYSNEMVVLQGAAWDQEIVTRDLKIEKLGRSLIRPGRVERFIFWIIRISEHGSVAQKIKDLLD